MDSSNQSKNLKEIKALTKVPVLTYNYEARPIDKIPLDDADQTANFIRPFFDNGSIRLQEEFLLIMLDDNKQAIGVFSLFKGVRGQVPVDHNLVLTLLLSYGCDYYIIAHSHPTSAYLPSPEDVVMTMSLKHKTDYFEIEMKDHLIITEKGYYSFEESFRLW